LKNLVISYLELNIKTSKFGYNPKIYDYIENIKRLAVNKNVMEFYSQPYKLKLINELFEGWNIKKVAHGYKFNCNPMLIDGYDRTKMLQIIIGDYKPKTLDDLIHLCGVAKLKLYWKNKL